jgi:DNA helicase MCM9
VTNPQRVYKHHKPLGVSTSLSGPLLSRFDIVLTLLDEKDPSWDALLADHILNCSERAPQNSPHEVRAKLACRRCMSMQGACA